MTDGKLERSDLERDLLVGRPPLFKEGTAQIGFKISPEAKRELQRQAKRAGKTMSAYAREVLVEGLIARQ